MEVANVLPAQMSVPDWNKLCETPGFKTLEPIPGFLMYGQLFKGKFAFGGHTYIGTGWHDPQGVATHVTISLLQ